MIDVDERLFRRRRREAQPPQGELQDMRPSGGGKMRLDFTLPRRGLIGYHGEFLTDTRGTGVMNHIFPDYAPCAGRSRARRNGVLISNARRARRSPTRCSTCRSAARCSSSPGEKVYEGMIIGEHTPRQRPRRQPVKAKKLTNIRTAGTDEAMLLTPPRAMTLEQALDYIEDDELVEVTPTSIRLRKRELDPTSASAPTAAPIWKRLDRSSVARGLLHPTLNLERPRGGWRAGGDRPQRRPASRNSWRLPVRSRRVARGGRRALFECVVLPASRHSRR